MAVSHDLISASLVEQAARFNATLGDWLAQQS
jgi:hypothetical protein